MRLSRDCSGIQSSWLGFCRNRFWRLSLRFCSSRRRFEPGVGRVFRRFLRGWRAARTRSARRRSASSRFRSCERSSSTTTRIDGPNASRSRRRCVSDNAAESTMLQFSSTLVAALFACCPPGPPEEVNLSRSSASGMTSDSLISMLTTPACHAGPERRVRPAARPPGWEC